MIRTAFPLFVSAMVFFLSVIRIGQIHYFNVMNSMLLYY